MKNKKIIAKNKGHLSLLIKEHIEKYGNNCSLNHIDVFKVKDMKDLFRYSTFNGNISEWNVSNVTNMSGMFHSSEFKQDISRWNVSNVQNMSQMFAYSLFNGDIRSWDVSSVEDMSYMFFNSAFDKDLTQWKPLSLKEIGKVLTFNQIGLKPYWYEAEDTRKAVNEFLIEKKFEEMNDFINSKDEHKKRNKI